MGPQVGQSDGIPELHSFSLIANGFLCLLSCILSGFCAVSSSLCVIWVSPIFWGSAKYIYGLSKNIMLGNPSDNAGTVVSILLLGHGCQVSLRVALRLVDFNQHNVSLSLYPKGCCSLSRDSCTEFPKHSQKMGSARYVLC